MDALIQEIRDFINNPRRQYNLLKNKEYWNQLCSSLDVIEDCELAITAYKNTEFNKGDGDKYLKVYGLLQAMFVQQDAVKNLWEALEVNGNFELDEQLRNIRKIRNESVGHPTKTFNNSYHFVSRITIEKQGFQLMSCHNHQKDFKDINVLGIIKKQKSLLSEKLNVILQSLKEEEKTHKEQFKTKKLESAFPNTYTYHISGIFESILSMDKRGVGNAHLKQINLILDKLKEMLNERGIVIDTYDSINLLYDELSFPIKKLNIYFDDGAREKIDDKTAYIFAFFIKEKMDELKSIVNEIDKEYEE